MLGNGRLEALCFDGEKRLAHIRGKLRKKVWINQGDIILLSLREYQDEKGDVILKYSADEARSLKAYGELPESAKINETDTYVFFFFFFLPLFFSQKFFFFFFFQPFFFRNRFVFLFILGGGERGSYFKREKKTRRKIYIYIYMAKEANAGECYT